MATFDNILPTLVHELLTMLQTQFRESKHSTFFH